MNTLAERIKATPLRWQFAALLLATQIVGQVVTLGFTDTVSGFLGLGRESFAADALAPLITTIGISQKLPASERDAVYKAAMSADPRFSFQPIPATAAIKTDVYSDAVLQLVKRRLPDDVNRRIIVLERSTQTFMPAPFLVDAAYNVDGTRWLRFTVGSRNSLMALPIMVMSLTVALLAFPLAFIAIWAGSALIAPMTALAAGAERFSSNLSGADVPETGPKEVRALARSLNTMRERIRRLVDDRSQMLAAVSHDMRTPLTRLRLQIESVDDADAREAMIEETKRIDGMISSALTFLRTQKEIVQPVRIDLAVLARTIADEHADMGQPVVFSGPAHVAALCDKDLIRRAIENLVQNAVIHGGNAEVSVRDDGYRVCICVADEGDGLGEHDIAKLVEPFQKGSRSRSGKDGSKGFGLGLAIAKSIAELHGGQLSLESNLPRGLLAQIFLPSGLPVQTSSAKTLLDNQPTAAEPLSFNKNI